MNAKQPVSDLPELNQSLFFCLEKINKICQNVSFVDRIHLLFEMASPSTLTLFYIDNTCDQKNIWTETFPAKDNQFRCNISSNTEHYNENSYSLFLADLIPSHFYQNMKHCYHIPLFWSNDCHCALQFLRANNQDFNKNEEALFNQLSELVVEVITHLFELIRVNKEKDFFEQEHLKDHLLVKITNTTISVLNLEKMLKSVSKDIIDYFNIDYVGVITPSHETAKQPLYSTYRLATTKRDPQNLAINLSQSVIKKIISKTPLTFHSIEHLCEQYNKNDMLRTMLNNNLQSLYCLPLNLANKQQGALLLAHRDCDIFTSNNVNLFEQITDRIAIAIDNIQSYQKVSNLNHSLANENVYLSEEINLFDSYHEIVGNSQSIQTVLEQVEMVADSSSSVLLLGETGTGKELFAKAIHQRSHRHEKTMIKINCSAVPSNLLESELFGHERGAFTNANARRIGRFELAKDSTLLLDEIGDIPLELQPKLLRVLQEKEIERLGSNKTISVNARVIAATNCNLEKMVADKEFRADLYYRLNVFPIIIPPLRDRKEDIPALVQFFTQKFANQMKKNINRIASSTLKQLCDYNWPGNVRELANIIERAVIITKENRLNLNMHSFLINDPHSIKDPISISAYQKESTNDHFSRNDLMQREKIIQVLKETNGIIAGPRGAAIKLGLKRTTLLSRMQKLNVSAKDILQEEF